MARRGHVATAAPCPCLAEAPAGATSSSRGRCARSAGRRTTMGTWRWLRVHLRQALVVVARGGDAQRVGDGRRAHAQVGGTRGVGPHDELRPHQAGTGGDRADAGNAAQFALRPRCGMRRSATAPSSPASTSTYFSRALPAMPTLTRARRAARPAHHAARFRLHLLLGDARRRSPRGVMLMRERGLAHVRQAAAGVECCCCRWCRRPRPCRPA